MIVSREFRAGALYLGVGIALSALYFAFPAGGSGQSTIYELLGGTSVLAILWAVRVHRPAHRLPWILLALANAAFVIGDVIGIFQTNPPVPSWGDGFYLAGYPLLTAALLLLMFAAGGRNRLAALTDAGIVTFAFAMFQWTWVMGPAVQSGGGDLGARIVYGLYPAMDVVVLSGFVGFFISPAWRTPSFRLLLGAVAALVVGDEVVGLAGSYSPGDLVDVTWMLSYLLFAAAAIHPSMRQLTGVRRMPTLRVSLVRIALLASALLAAPATLLVQKLRGRTLDAYEIVGLAAVVAILVVLRLTGILRALERIRVRERSARAVAEEAQAQLARQNDELLEADRLKDEFVALISHDLRTPLTSIVGYVELVLDEAVEPKLDDERRTHLAIVSRSAERLLRLVDDLLFVARLQAGRLAIEAREIDLAEIAASAVDAARPLAEQNGLTLSYLGEPHVRIEGDRGRMFQLLDNLISNAIKFTPEGGRVDVHAVHAAGGVALEVSDTGIGLGPGELERVFERFFRSERATDQQIPGTGLGLFISRAIAQAHGGTITASSRTGSGTTFRIELPLRVEPKPGEADAGESELVA
ncbi:MAG TPA: HAMP domain-containing sensor histidine kinase [Gaiellaceae bacterium]|nr:HAMP domain-containing sensor histidine kinase [Gaiellaceae bacterium]